MLGFLNWGFVTMSIFLGVGLAMDAFSVSMANGLNEPKMRNKKLILIAGIFAGFQILMPLAGWICVHTIAQLFESFQKLIPWIALALLGYIGGKMLIEGIKNDTEEADTCAIGFMGLIVQGVATSIDALSVGFTISDYNFAEALTCSLIIGIVTFFICVAGVLIGKTFGTKLSNKASILGGIILLAIGVEIFITGVF